MRTKGELSDVARARIEQALLEGLAGSDARVIGPDQTRAVADASCEAPTCLQPVVEHFDADYVAWVEVEAEGRDYALSLRLSSKEGSESRRDANCEICGFDEVAATVRDEATVMASKLQRLTAPGVLILETEPPGMTVYIDGVPVGETPLEREIEVGPHQLRLEGEGFAVREQSLTVKTGVQERMLLEMTVVESADADKSRVRRILGWSFAGVGVAGLATGGAFLAYHHKEVPGRCDEPEDIDVNGLCRWRYNTLAPGLGLVAAGGASLIAGATLLAIDKKKRKGGDTARTRVLVSPRSVSLTHRF
jgi:hypothetical protein